MLDNASLVCRTVDPLHAISIFILLFGKNVFATQWNLKVIIINHTTRWGFFSAFPTGGDGTVGLNSEHSDLLRCYSMKYKALFSLLLLSFNTSGKAGLSMLSLMHGYVSDSYLHTVNDGYYTDSLLLQLGSITQFWVACSCTPESYRVFVLVFCCLVVALYCVTDTQLLVRMCINWNNPVVSHENKNDCDIKHLSYRISCWIPVFPSSNSLQQFITNSNCGSAGEMQTQGWIYSLCCSLENYTCKQTIFNTGSMRPI